MTYAVEWRSVPDFPTYEVSNDGQVRNAKNGRIKKQRLDTENRPVVTLSRGGYVCPKMVHRLVADAFLGQLPAGFETCHEDGQKENNSLANLRYDTKVANEADKKRHGTDNTGERNGRAQLTRDQVIAIRQDKRTSKAIAADLGVGRWAVYCARRGKTWRNL